MLKLVPMWKLGLRWYSVQAQLVALALALLMLAGVERPPLTWMLWGLIGLNASAIALRFVSQPDLYETAFEDTRT